VSRSFMLPARFHRNSARDMGRPPHFAATNECHPLETPAPLSRLLLNYNIWFRPSGGNLCLRRTVCAKMSRYRLDDLGCFQFEALIQSLVKVQWGLAIESWGGRGDYGRDAYYASELRFPDEKQQSDGPFLFQIKFVEHANAAGANCEAAILDSVHKERLRIEVRKNANKPGGTPEQRIRYVLGGQGFWLGLKQYMLLTNAPLSAALRRKIEAILIESLPECKVHSFGESDICDFLDNRPNLRRAFPQLLSIRDLDELIGTVLDRESMNRSRAAIEQARETCAVFVPTSAFERAWDVLREHNFVVLEGPPEMGKTAIARMIALTQASLGWEAIVCDGPSDLFQRLKDDKKQVFIADDAFGRTEYDPTRGRRWEQRLDAVLHSLDSKHWLIWTSRKHILERALRAMDLQEHARNFPSPGAVLVDAGDLDLREKALILYRHARGADLEHKARAIVRSTARALVQNADFTPERIRRFVDEDLPDLALPSNAIKSNTRAHATLCERINSAIRNPTQRMRKTFAALPAAHKWFLISLLEAADSEQASVFASYESYCPLDERQPAPEVFDELRESFVTGEEDIDWMHPSYRDLVIDELSADAGLQHEFLSSMGLSGIKLAISDTGGKEGDRFFPLMNLPDSWDILEARCQSLVRSGDVSASVELITALHSARKEIRDTTQAHRLTAILLQVCEDARRRWNATREPLSSSDLDAYVIATTDLRPLPPLPILDPSWERAECTLRKELEESGEVLMSNPSAIREWLAMASVILNAEPRFLKQIDFPTRNVDDIGRLSDLIAQGAKWGERWDTREELEAMATHTAEAAKLLIGIAKLAPEEFACSRNVAKDLVKKRVPALKSLAEGAESEQEEDDDSDEYRERSHGSSEVSRFGLEEVDVLFRDL
jgi:hypothetical protein